MASIHNLGNSLGTNCCPACANIGWYSKTHILSSVRSSDDGHRMLTQLGLVGLGDDVCYMVLFSLTTVFFLYLLVMTLIISSTAGFISIFILSFIVLGFCHLARECTDHSSISCNSKFHYSESGLIVSHLGASDAHMTILDASDRSLDVHLVCAQNSCLSLPVSVKVMVHVDGFALAGDGILYKPNSDDESVDDVWVQAGTTIWRGMLVSRV